VNLHIAPIKTISGDAFLKKITPFNKEVENLFERIAKNGKAYTENSHLTRMLPRKYPDLFDSNTGVLEIYRNERRRKSVIIPFDGVQFIPLVEPTSRINEKRRKKYGVYRL